MSGQSAAEPRGGAAQGRLRALVTGGARRLGRAICLELANTGAFVAVHHRASAAAASATLEEVRRAGGQGLTLQADLRERAAAARLVAEACAAAGGLDLLVASAADFPAARWPEVSDRDWDDALDLILGAQFRLARAATEPLRVARGSIVFITCASTRVPFRGRAPYVVAKAGLSQLTRVLALELAPDVRVNAVAPGTVLPAEGTATDAVEGLRQRIPLGRVGQAEDVARAVAYLARADFVTGQELFVDGGRSVAAFERFSG